MNETCPTCKGTGFLRVGDKAACPVCGGGGFLHDSTKPPRFDKPQRLVVLYRDIDLQPEELAAMREHFYATDSRLDLREGDLVVGRYSVLPFYAEQERDIQRLGARLLNTKREHDYLANALEWAHDLGDLTPQTWSLDEFSRSNAVGSFVVKGQTNSRKHLWKTHMFAATRADVMQVVSRLMDDSLIGQQGLVVRRYEPYLAFMRGLYDLPITREFRFFVCDGHILCGGYYWSSHVEELRAKGEGFLLDPDKVPRDFLAEAVRRIGYKARFYALDVAYSAHYHGPAFGGHWRVVEANDGQQAGLSENDPQTLYAALKDVLA